MLTFACVGSRADTRSAGPAITLDLRVGDGTGRRVHTAALRVQLRIDPRPRRYSAAETARLADLFGEPERWGETLQPLQLATVPVLTPSFVGSVTVPVTVPLTYDLDIAAARYLHSLDDGEIPLLLLFSGTLFYAGDAGVQVGLVPWHEEAAHGLPVGVWRAAMDAFHPGGGWVRLRRDTLDRLSAYRSAHTLPTWDDALERLLKEAGDG
ncbi:hypothetical protein SAMN05443637_1037 [Pseudonocardia thermophila]|uniref:Uncharacterized protein n=1 Tax=Pseudonocardia thermophila TaxID=1848 RepID=A0A1M6PZU0_PSETH|nr:hypothetical protein SAMN05443637_1037 [Pseudonocardia thermophila]